VPSCRGADQASRRSDTQLYRASLAFSQLEKRIDLASGFVPFMP
jgi:hypothetical protein